MTWQRRRLVAILGIMVLYVSTLATQEPLPGAGNPLLLPGKEAPAIVTGNSAAQFRVHLLAGDALDVHVTQPAVDLRLRLVDPSGAELSRANLRRPQQGSERLHTIAVSDGEHVLHIEIAGADTTGTVKVVATIASLHPADDVDRALVRAATAYARAEVEAARGGGDAIRSSLALFRDAAADWKTAGAAFEEATALNRIGLAEMQLSNLKEALRVFGECLRLRRTIGDRYGEGVALNNLAGAHVRTGDYQNAAALYAEALDSRRAVGDRNGEAWSLMGAGVVDATLKQGWADALRHFRHALDLMEETHDERGTAEALYYIGYAHSKLNEYDQSVRQFNASLQLRRTLNDLAGQASVLTQLASIHLTLGDLERALELLNDTLPLRRKAGDRRGEGYTLQTLGVAFTRQSEYTRAFDYLSQALRLFETVGDLEGQTSALTYMAGARAGAGAHQEALTLAARARALMNGRRNLMTTILLSVIGDAQRSLGLHDRAARAYEEALLEARRLGEPLPAARALTGLGRVARARGDLETSRRQLLDALDTIESVRAGLPQSELRATFLGASQPTYDAAIETLMDLHRRGAGDGYAAEALHVSERRRARALVEMLAEAQIDVRAGVHPELLAHEDRIQHELSRRTAGAELAAGRPEPDRTIAELVDELRKARADIRAQSPRYSAVFHAEPLGLSGIQQLLDRDTMLLEYSLGERRSYVWAITQRTMTVREIASRAVVEEAVKKACKLVEDSAVRRARGPMQHALRELGTMLLVPIAQTLKVRRLAIVADGGLQYVPFAALPHPAGQDGNETDDPLVVRHEIVMLPSATALDVQRRAVRQSAGQRRVAVLADPVFKADDPRVSGPLGNNSAAQDGAGTRELQRAAQSLGVDSFERLPFSGGEAAAIRKRAGAGASLIAVGFDATRELATSAALGDYRVLHFATHTVLDARHPELSGIVLSLVDRQGQPRNGFLRLHDIFNLHLAGTLVVLSGCETALGRDVRGEGLIGLTRGFMYAGASQVVASLWNVRDRATAELMDRLYAGLLERGLTTPAALRAAQLELLGDPRWQMPVYWSGFVVQGDWLSQRW